MNVIIPCAGLGSRFKSEYFNMPKPLIQCMMKPLVSWVIESIQRSVITSYIFIVVVRNPNYDMYYEMIASNYGATIIYLDGITKGAAHTCMIAAELMVYKHLPTVCIDCDTFYTTDILSKCIGNTVITFEEPSLDCFSFVTCDTNDRITNIAEKIRISSHAVSGVYAFDTASTLIAYANQAMSATTSEVYMSHVIGCMITDNITVINSNILKSDCICVGTPAQLYTFYNNIAVNPLAHSVISLPQRRVCFDLDGTLLSAPVVPGDYSTCEPIQSNINMCNYMKQLNYYVIIHTARRMRTHDGNVGKIIKDVAKITIDSIEAFGIQHDELLFGKPYADVYIDDKAMNSNGFLQKDLGLYFNTFETRVFNSHTNNVLPIITKSSVNSLSDEIHWYTHIPCEIKDMFPLFIRTCDNTYTVEYIQGQTVSDLFVNNCLVSNLIESVLNSLVRIHASSHVLGDQVANTFYIDKLNERLLLFDDTTLSDNLSLIQSFETFFQFYTFTPCNIHGDPVFTNIIINTYSKLKFIDMRGSFGSGPSLLGDPLYDFAKVKQSLVGYDFILKNVHKWDTTEHIHIFDTYILQRMGHSALDSINMITKYLIFTMLPLHSERDRTTIELFHGLINLL